MKKVICMLLSALMLYGCSWSKVNKTLLTTYTALNVADIAQTTYIYDNPSEFKEGNPLLSEDTYIPIMVGSNLLLYYLADKLTEKQQTYVLVPLTMLKAGVVGYNAYLGVGFKIPF